jgi:hypothetical protein
MAENKNKTTGTSTTSTTSTPIPEWRPLPSGREAGATRTWENSK